MTSQNVGYEKLTPVVFAVQKIIHVEKVLTDFLLTLLTLNYYKYSQKAAVNSAAPPDRTGSFPEQLKMLVFAQVGDN